MKLSDTARSVDTTTTRPDLLGVRLLPLWLLSHSLQLILALLHRPRTSWMSARKGTTRTVVLARGRVVGSMKNMLFPPPVGSTTMSGLYPRTTAMRACACCGDR